MTDGEDDHENVAWHEAIKTVKPLKNKKPIVNRVVKLKKPVIAPKDHLPPSINKLGSQSIASPLPAKRLKQLRQKKIPVEATIDLHGMTIPAAHKAAQRFLINAYRNELRCVEVITGKGDAIRGTGLLKREFPQWLGEAELRLIILHYEENRHRAVGHSWLCCEGTEVSIEFNSVDLYNHSMTEPAKHKFSAERLEKLNHADLIDLCDATVAAIEKDGGFGWVTVPERDVLQRYWHGVIAVPLRDLFVVRLDGAIAGTAQLVRVPLNNQAQGFSAQLTTFFVAPWARGFGLSEQIIEAVEKRAKELGLYVINLDVRETQFAAIKVFKKMGYIQWGMNPHYAMVNGRMVPGYYFHKMVTPLSSITPIET